jgi:hypothetical protein
MILMGRPISGDTRLFAAGITGQKPDWPTVGFLVGPKTGRTRIEALLKAIREVEAIGDAAIVKL